METKPEIDYSVIPANCIRWMTRGVHGAYTHFCFSIPPHNCPDTRGCRYSQYKPVWWRMKRKAERNALPGK